LLLDSDFWLLLFLMEPKFLLTKKFFGGPQAPKICRLRRRHGTWGQQIACNYHARGRAQHREHREIYFFSI